MRVWLRLVCFACALFSFKRSASASSTIPLPADVLVRVSDAIFRGTVLSISTFRDTNGTIYTRTTLRVDEPLKGTFPAAVVVVHRGGRVGDEDELYGLSPHFKNGEECLLFLTRGSDHRLHCTQGAASARQLHRAANLTGFVLSDQWLLDEVRQLTSNGAMPGADATDQAGLNQPSPADLTGMLGGIPSRFLQPDRGDPIPCLIDADMLPAGMTLAEATNAVQQALDAWKAVTSLKFKIEGIQSFLKGADTITNSDDRKLRIQLHDNYNSITEPNVLGIGGRLASSSVLTNTTWNIGGNVGGTEFWRTKVGYVVLEATNPAMQTLSTFTEVLCHEIGHALNLAHSSEDPNEPDPVLNQAIMYYQAHADGRGAALGSYDVPVIQQIFPSNNTPPFTFSRVMDITTAFPTAPAIPGINEVDLRGYDLQSGPVTLILTNVTFANGDFSTVSSLVRYTPRGFFADSPRLDPAGTSSYDRFSARYSDGTNASPYVSVRVISFNEDDDVTTDGIPDNWMLANFGHPDPQAGDQSRAVDDKDGDGLNNLQEYRAGMDPMDPASAQRITLFNTATLEWQAKPYELYEILGTTNFITWTRVGAPVLPTNSVGTFTDFFDPAVPHRVFRVLKVP